MATVRAICRPCIVVSTICSRFSRQPPVGGGVIREFTANCASPRTSPPGSSRLCHSKAPIEMGSRLIARRIFARASRWNSERSPYETLELDRDVDEEEIKAAYRRLAKHYHPDVYDGSGDLEEGETAEARFIKIQAAYELLMDKGQRGQYDNDHRVNPMKASKAWMEWLVKKKKAFDQRGDMAVSAWAEQQQREMNLRVRRLSRSKTLLDVVHVFNMSSSVSQEQQSLIVLEGGPTVFRDYYPSNKASLVLECHWDGVKFCLHEKFAPTKRAVADVEGTLLLEDDQRNDVHSLPIASTIKYNKFGVSGEAMDDNEIGWDNCLVETASAEPSISAIMKNKKDTNGNMPPIQIRKPDCVMKNNNDHSELLLPNEECSEDLLVGKDSSERSRLSDSTPPQSSKPEKSKSKKKRKVAFISVDVPLKTEAKLDNSRKKLRPASNKGLSERFPSSANETTDHFFSLLVDGNKTKSLF